MGCWQFDFRLKKYIYIHKIFDEFRFRFFFNPQQWGWSSSGALQKKPKKKSPKSYRGESEGREVGERGEALSGFRVSEFQKGHMHGDGCGADWNSAKVSVCTLVLS